MLGNIIFLSYYFRVACETAMPQLTGRWIADFLHRPITKLLICPTVASCIT